MRVGFIGLGDQGAPMAQALAEGGWPVVVWARRPATVDALRDQFAFDVAADVQDLGRSCDVVAVCVDRDDDVEELLVTKGLLAAMSPGSAFVNHGTGTPAAAVRFHALGAEAGVDVLDAPVSGGSEKARARTLTVMVGGDEVAFKRCAPLFEAFGSLVSHLGGPGSGQVAKLVNNTLLAMNLDSTAKVLSAAAALGLDVTQLSRVMLASSGASMALQQLAVTPPDLLRHFQPMLHKDVSAFEATAQEHAVSAAELVDVARRGVDGIEAAIELLGRDA